MSGMALQVKSISFMPKASKTQAVRPEMTWSNCRGVLPLRRTPCLTVSVELNCAESSHRIGQTPWRWSCLMLRDADESIFASMFASGQVEGFLTRSRSVIEDRDERPGRIVAPQVIVLVCSRRLHPFRSGLC